MIRFLSNIYIRTRFFGIMAGIIFLFVLSFAFTFLLAVAQTALILLVLLLIVDGMILFNRKLALNCRRFTPRIMSMGNENLVQLEIENLSAVALHAMVIDELPYQFQERENSHLVELRAKEKLTIEELLRPVQRGEYHFGKVHLFLFTNLGLLERRMSFDIPVMVPVYPSVMDVKKFELRAVSRVSNYYGFKKLRRIGQSYEFEQISEYQQGDNFQHMNWKATGKTGRLMINNYTEEKAQPIYCFIDKSRYMKMPFDGMSLLDYSINASLIIASSSLRRYDKAGLLTFSDRVESMVKANSGRHQLEKILQTLYRQEETRMEANYELMYSYIRKKIQGRSLVFLFANFDSFYALERVLPVLRKINMNHLLVVVVFENSELERFQQEDATDTLDIYYKTLARKVSMEKKQVLNELRNHAIQVVHTRPQDLSLNVLNKYLELKARGAI